jgi:hypothetical protein
VVVQECGAGLVDVRRSPRLGVAAPSVEDVAWIDNGPGWVGVDLGSADAVVAVVPDVAAFTDHLRDAVLQLDRPTHGTTSVEGGGGAMEVTPDDLVGFGRNYVVPADGDRPAGEGDLTARRGPSLRLTWGSLSVADPWWPEMLPGEPHVALGIGEHPTCLSVLPVPRPDGSSVPVGCAASIGDVGSVTEWHPLVVDGRHFQLDVDSGLGAFYDATDEAALRPLFEDAPLMQSVAERAMAEGITSMEVAGRTAAVVFAFPDGQGLYPAYRGSDADGRIVAVLLDTGLLALAEPGPLQGPPDGRT